MSSAVKFQASHIIELEELTEWLAEHGVAIEQVREARVEIGRLERGHGLYAWLDVRFYLLNDKGQRYRAGGTDDAAEGSATIPLRSWPRLTPVPLEETSLRHRAARDHPNS